MNNEKKVEKEKTQVVFEITLSNLRASGGEIDEQDFMDRARLLCSLGQTVLISNFQEYYKLVEYFNLYSKNRMGLAMGINNLIDYKSMLTSKKKILKFIEVSASAWVCLYDDLEIRPVLSDWQNSEQTAATCWRVHVR